MSTTVELNKTRTAKSVWKWFWLGVIPILILVGLITRLDAVELNQAFRAMNNGLTTYGWLCVLLLPLNMSLEGLNWYFIVRKELNYSYWKALKIVMSGRSLNLIGPVGVGDAYIRYDQWQGQKVHSAGWILTERMLKMIPTLLFGILSTIFLVNQVGEELLNWLMYFFTGFLVLLILVVSVFGRIRHWLIEKYEILRTMPRLNLGIIGRILAIAILRYGVFASQFVLVLLWVGIDAPSQVLYAGVAWVLFVKSLVPNFTVMGDLTKREFSSIFFFSMFDVSVESVALASFLVWLINIILPALIGLIMYLDLKHRSL